MNTRVLRHRPLLGAIRVAATRLVPRSYKPVPPYICRSFRATGIAQMERSKSRSLPPQSFSLNNLNRSILERRDADFLEKALPEADILLVSGNQCCVSGSEEDSQEAVTLSWLRLEALTKMGFKSELGRLILGEWLTISTGMFRT